MGARQEPLWLCRGWESSSDDVQILDCRVAKLGGIYTLTLTYDFLGDSHRRVLKSVESIERFLTKPVDSWNAATPDIESLGRGHGTVSCVQGIPTFQGDDSTGGLEVPVCRPQPFAAVQFWRRTSES